MALVFRFAARSDSGVVRTKNDDSGYAGRFFAVVADGMGGHAGGNVASASTVLDLAHLDTRGFAEPDTVLPDEIQTANAFLNKLVEANPKLAGMGTTITSLLITENRMQFAHIGDSRAYRLKKSRFRQVSKDHTFVQRLVDEGRLDPDQAEYHPHKNVLMRVLGDVDASPELDITSFPLEAGERWLLCSDGLNAVVSDRLIEQKLRSTQSLESIVEDLVNLTIEGGAPDNVTVVCLEVVEAQESDLAPNRTLPLTERAVAAAAEGYGAQFPEEAEVTGATDAVATDAAADAEAAELAEVAENAHSGSGSPEDTMRLIPVVNPEALSRHRAEEDELSPVSTAMFGEDTEALPHSLVGAVATATETGMLPVVPRNVDEHPVAALLTGQPLVPVRQTYSEMLDGPETAPAPRRGESADPGRPGPEEQRGDDAGHPGGSAPAEDITQIRAAERRGSLHEAESDRSGLDRAAGDEGQLLEAAPDEADADEAEREVADLDDEQLQDQDLSLAVAASQGRRRRSWFLPAFVGLLVVLLAAVTFLGYIWTQTQYYVGEDDGEVAVYNGVAQSLGPISLSEVDEHAGLDLDELTPYHRSRVASGIPADDRAHAETIVDQLRGVIGGTDPDDGGADTDPDGAADDDPDDGGGDGQ